MASAAQRFRQPFADLLSAENDRRLTATVNPRTVEFPGPAGRGETNYAKFSHNPFDTAGIVNTASIGGAQDVGARLRKFMPKHAAPNPNLEAQERYVKFRPFRSGTQLRYWASWLVASGGAKPSIQSDGKPGCELPSQQDVGEYRGVHQKFLLAHNL